MHLKKQKNSIFHKNPFFNISIFSYKKKKKKNNHIKSFIFAENFFMVSKVARLLFPPF